MTAQNNQHKSTHLQVLNLIRNEQPHFSTAMQLVADYILKHFHKIPFLSISALSDNIGVSPNTVIKFCNQLGFAKFSDFKKVFSEHAHSTLTTPSELEEKNPCTTPTFFAQGLEEEVSVISATLNNPTNHENLPKAVSMITGAEHVYICGGSRSYPIASIFALNLQSMCLSAHPLYFDRDTFWVKVRMATPKDLVIFITMPQYSDVAVEAMQQLHKKKVPMLLLTDTGLSPALPYADLALYCSYYENYYLYSNVGVHAMINVLCRGVNYELDAKKYRKSKNKQ